MADRVYCFDQVLLRLSYYLNTPDTIERPDFYLNLANLREKVGRVWLSDQGIGNLSDSYLNGRHPSEELIATFQLAGGIFREVAGLISSGEWGYVKDISAPGVVASALLIEGWGLFLERNSGITGIRPIFVRALEEVMGTEYAQTGLWQDVRPWVKEESYAFSPAFIVSLDHTATQ